MTSVQQVKGPQNQKLGGLIFSVTDIGKVNPEKKGSY